MVFDTPVLLIIFNRPDHTQKVFDALKLIQPSNLYIAADGPRESNPLDLDRCKQTREIIKQIDWSCQLKTLFRDENLGCGKGPSDSISWLFSHEEYGIILEDDCVPDRSFFFFCDELLKKYKDDSRIMHIAGTNHNPTFVRDHDYSYFFSQIGHMWGWATWGRAWKLFDYEMKRFNEVGVKNYFNDLYPNYLIRKYMIRKFSETYTGKIKGVWDYQWEFTRLINSGLTIMPKNNLVSNIGFGADATHTFSDNNNFSETRVQKLNFPLNHPPFIIKDRESERKHFYRMFAWILKRKIFSTIGFKGYDFNG
ncbi:nucleotide-diphospho-sugar transferase [Rhodonellum sp.]|uniref:nucleotide-diphospho-sugar transferase n=1 Tax=Rhodonellum sp. TaxID=2231180 RepID=UPI0027246216|nr:nucleotide-diphospho-sugar transferase [Rhodonellum sp.]MDO9551485.1 nucleotide-diphospho-sugar transferase [Rhodonellum sp.]